MEKPYRPATFTSGRRKGTPISYIQEKGRGRDYAWEFFVKPTTESKISKELYPDIYENMTKEKKKKGWVYYHVQNRFKDWKEEKYFDRVKIKEKEGRKCKGNSTRKDTVTNYIFNLNSFFEYAESRGVHLLHSQKMILEVLFIFDTMRSILYKNFKDKEDFITAILKYYVGEFIKRKIVTNDYKYLRRDLRRNKKKSFSTFDFLDDLYQYGIPYPSTSKIKEENEAKIPKKELDKYGYKKIDLSHTKIIDLTNLSETERLRYKLKDQFVNVYFYYYLYETFQKQMKDIMTDLDYKMMSLLLGQNFLNFREK